MIVLKRCSGCKELYELNDENFAPRPTRPCGWYPKCRKCDRAKGVTIYARKVVASSQADRPCGRCGKSKPADGFGMTRIGGRASTCLDCLAQKSSAKSAAKRSAWLDYQARVTNPDKPGPKESPENRHFREARERELAILLLIGRYESVRSEPSRARDAAYNALALALQRHGRPVSDGVRQWEWARGMGEITSRLIRREWRAPSDPHADPGRVAKDGLRTADLDLVEI